MIKLAVEDNPFFNVSRIEIDRKDESYFIFTLEQLFELNLQADLSVIIGTDAFNEVDKWKNYMENTGACIIYCYEKARL